MADLGPQQEHTYQFDITEDMISDLRETQTGPTQIRYGGIIQYSDSFGSRHETGFAFRTNANEPIGERERLLHISTTGNYST